MANSPPWMADLQPATWRGVTFYVEDESIKSAPRTAIHEYPYKDKVWVEFLGRGPRVFSFRGFLVGDDVASQYEEMRAACEEPGHGELVHPRVGRFTVALVTAGFDESKEAANVVGLQFEFLETATASGSATPTTIGGAADGFVDAVSNISTASVGDFVRTTGAAIRSGQAVVQTVTSTAQGYVREVQTVVRDATRAVNAVKPLANMLGVSDRAFGRFLSPLNRVSATVNTVNSGLGSINRANYGATQLIRGASRAAGTVENVGTRVIGLARSL